MLSMILLPCEIEWLIAGDCIAGMHEVVTKRTTDAIKAASEENRNLWRVSSTVITLIFSSPLLMLYTHRLEVEK